MAFAALFVVAMAIRGWAALEWEANFDSDEAIFGLMAQDILVGEYVPTVYGTQHLGSIESYLAALNFSLFGAGVVQFRAASMFLMALFMGAHAWYVYRTWGTWTALASLAFVAVPGFHILSWTYQPVGAYAAMLFLGTAILSLAYRVRRETQTRGTDLFLLGVLAGLGLWSNQMILVYVVAAALPAFLLSPEWAWLRKRLGQFIRGRVGLPPAEVGPTLVVGLALTGTVAFFSSGCNPVWQFARLAQIGKAMLVLVGAGLAIGLVASSSRRRKLVTGALITGSGLAIGYAPLWVAWATGQQPPNLALIPSCPTGTISRALLLAEEILPELVGVRPLARAVPMGWLAAFATVAVLLASLSAFIWFLWVNRRELWSLLSWDPSPVPEAGRATELAVLLGLPLALSLFSGNTVDLHSIRHLILTWQAMTIVIGIAVVRVPRFSPAAKAVVVGLWAGFLAVSNIAFAQTQWPAKFTRFDRDAILQLENFLGREGVSTVYTDYWGAFALDFLLEERITFAPYNGLDRIPAYSDKARAEDRLALIFPLDRRPGDGVSVEVLNNHLGLENPVSGEGPAREEIRTKLSDMRVEDRTPVGYWDVWILGRN